MSLTSRINGRDPADKALQELLRATLPPKAEFTTVSGRKPFIARDYTLRAPYALSRRAYAGVVGTAFDYLARMVIARTVDGSKGACFKMLVAEFGRQPFEQWSPLLGSELVREVFGVYDHALTTLANYVSSSESATLAAAIEACCKLARFEYIARNPRMAAIPFLLADAARMLLSPEPEEIVCDLDRLIDVFAEVFLTSGIVTPGSVVIFNPKFAALELGGADADIVIDSVLYDFKTTKTAGYKWQDIAQLWGYYLLGDSRGLHDAASMTGQVSATERPMRRLALYRARFGEIEYIDIERLDRREIERASLMLGEYLNSAGAA